MKKLIPLLLVTLLLAFTVPALAGDGDVQFYAFKTITLAETFTYSETVAFTGTGNFIFDGEAWAKVQEQQELYSSILTEIDTAATKSKSASIAGSFNNGTGIANVNQAPGNLNNQANEVALSLGSSGAVIQAPTASDTYVGMYCEAQVVSVQYNGILYDPATDTRTAAGNVYNTGGFNKSDTIENSFNGFTGLANVNQSAGSLNNQGNAVAIAGGVNQVVAKAATNVMLAQNNAYNHMTEGLGALPGNNTNDTISNGSFGGAFGVFNVNQSSGSLNNQKNVVAISFQGPVTR
jgi:hypothetical protein